MQKGQEKADDKGYVFPLHPYLESHNNYYICTYNAYTSNVSKTGSIAIFLHIIILTLTDIYWFAFLKVVHKYPWSKSHHVLVLESERGTNQ